jgi:FkbM family methyltransferase
MILIEPSEYYFRFLQENSKKFPNQIELVNFFIGSGKTESGELRYWGGTARFESDPGSQSKIQTRRLQDVVDENVVFIKIDTDGFDKQIIYDSLTYFKRKLPAIIFENEIRDYNDLQMADRLFLDLTQIGYMHFIIWDDPGFYITATNSLETLRDLNLYLYKVSSYKYKGIHNYDVLCLKAEDIDVFNKIRDFYRKY